MKRVLQFLALATIVLSAVACSGGSDTNSTPQVVKMGVDDASKMKKKDDEGSAGPDASKKDDKAPAAGTDAKAPAAGGDAKAPAGAPAAGKDAKAPAADAPKTGG